MDEFMDLARYVLAEFLVYFEAYWQILALFVLVHLLLALVLSRRKKEKHHQAQAQEQVLDVAASRQKQPKNRKAIAPVAPSTENQSSDILLATFQNDLYQIEEILYQGRFGLDFVASREGRRTLVNGKWWKKKVNDNAVLSISDARTYYRCDFVLLVSERGFTRAARKAAANHNVTLWDRRQLQRESIRSRSGSLEVEVAVGADYVSDK